MEHVLSSRAGAHATEPTLCAALSRCHVDVNAVLNNHVTISQFSSDRGAAYDYRDLHLRSTEMQKSIPMEQTHFPIAFFVFVISLDVRLLVLWIHTVQLKRQTFLSRTVLSQRQRTQGRGVSSPASRVQHVDGVSDCTVCLLIPPQQTAACPVTELPNVLCITQASLSVWFC